MKNLFLILFLATLTFGLTNRSISQEYDKIFSEGTIFIYQVDYFGEEYLFIATLIDHSEDGIKFKYFFSNSGNQGIVTMTAEAKNNATKLFNFFTGIDYELTDQTSGWLSDDVVEKLKKEEKVNLDLGDGTIETFSLWHDDELFSDLEDGEYEYPITLDNRFEYTQSLHTYAVKNTDESHSIGFYSKDGINLILEMDLGWQIHLVSIL